MRVVEYRNMVEKCLNGYLSAEQFVLKFNEAFLGETGGFLDDEAFSILQDLFEDGEAYSPMWTDVDANDFRITENTFRTKAQEALSRLDHYLETHG